MLLYVFIAFSVFSALYSVFYLEASFIMLPVNIITAFVGINLLYILMLFVISLFLPDDDSRKYDEPWARKLVYVTMDWIVRLSRLNVSVTGAEMIPDGKFVVVSNHLSKYDPIVTYVFMKDRKLAFLSKKENMEIPIAGKFIRMAGFLALDRENPLRAMRTVRKAADMIKNDGYSFGIYPEGTRSKTGELLSFKTGAFVVAQKANVPIVILKTVGTNEIKQKSPFKITDVGLRFLDVIPAERVNQMTPEELSEYCHDVIKNEFVPSKEDYANAHI